MGKHSGDVETRYNPSKGPRYWVHSVNFVEHSRKGAYVPGDFAGEPRRLRSAERGRRRQELPRPGIEYDAIEAESDPT